MTKEMRNKLLVLFFPHMACAAKDESCHLRAYHLILFITIGFIVKPSVVYGFELFDSVQVHGFASQVMFLTSDNNLFGKSDDGVSLDFTELGINGSWSPIPKLRFSMQVLSRRAGIGHDGTPAIDFGLLDYSPVDTGDYRLGVRLGRVRLPYGLLNDTRDVAFTRPSVLLPQSIYFERTRDLTISADGALLYGESRNSWGNLTLELAGVSPRTDDSDTKLSIMGPGVLGELDSDMSFSGRLGYDLDDGKLRLAVSGVYTSFQYHPAYSLGDRIPRGSVLFTPVIFSAQYNTAKWTFMGEYAIRPFETSGFSETSIVGDSYYVQAAYRITNKWEIMTRFDSYIGNRDDPNGDKAEAASRGRTPNYSQFAKDWTVGLRYDITPWMMARGEYHIINGTGWLPPQDNPVRADTVQHWNMWAFLISLRF
jgi:hypothetical protein